MAGLTKRHRACLLYHESGTDSERGGTCRNSHEGIFDAAIVNLDDFSAYSDIRVVERSVTYAVPVSASSL